MSRTYQQRQNAGGDTSSKPKGIDGQAVAEKCHIVAQEKYRSLIRFIQFQSLQEGGLNAFVNRLLDRFPDSLVTPRMVEHGTPAKGVYSEKEARDIGPWLGLFVDEFLAATSTNPDRPVYEEPKPLSASERRYSRFQQLCRDRAKSRLPALLVDFCVDLEIDPEEWAGKEFIFGFDYFRNLLDALLAMQAEYESEHLSAVAGTSIASQCWKTLDYGLGRRRMVVIQGESGIGKSEAARSWVKRHAGQARLVRLKAGCSRTTLFRSICESLGFSASFSYSPTVAQAKIETFLPKSGLMLVLDEAHFLWPPHKRISTRPEMIDWINTALVNQGVPVALITTPQFSERLQAVEQQTGWNSDQFKRRVQRFTQIDGRPSKEDLEAVARCKMPHAKASWIQLVVGYAMTMDQGLQFMVDAIEDAAYLAEQRGLEEFDFEDLQEAIEQIRIPSVKAMAAATNTRPQKRSQQARKDEPAAPVQHRGKAPAESMQSERNRLAESSRKAPATGPRRRSQVGDLAVT